MPATLTNVQGKAASPLPWSSSSTTSRDSTFQQLAPYIGRIKTDIARFLIATYSKRGDLLLDPFAGSGVIPFEAAVLGRSVIAADLSPYAHTLATAKFSAPPNEDDAVALFEQTWKDSFGRRSNQDLRRVPAWVRKFFHPTTLRNALALRDELVNRRQYFLIACLLGILHHQRPGFLSYPSSHLVPYLRDRLFPRDQFPQLYEERDIRSRMLAKIRRTYRRPPQRLASSRILLGDSARLKLEEPIDAVITSPPYMNELDYVRDNRLRLWFLLRHLPTHGDARTKDREKSFQELIGRTFRRIVPRLRANGHLVLVVGDSRRGRQRNDAALLVTNVFGSAPFRNLRLVRTFRDRIPDIRRTRRDLAGTKNETILVYQKTSSRLHG